MLIMLYILPYCSLVWNNPTIHRSLANYPFKNMKYFISGINNISYN